MDSHHTCHFNLLFSILVIENLLLYFLRKIPPSLCIRMIQTLIQKFRSYYKIKKQGRPFEYWKIYHHIFDMIQNNADWGASKIHSEILKLGFHPSLSTVKRIIKRILKGFNPFNNHWKFWLQLLDHFKNEIVAMDLCRIQTVYGTTLYALAFIHHSTRKIVHFNITDHPTRDWVLRQIQEAKYLCSEFQVLLRDNDVLFSGSKILKGLKDLEIASLVTPPASPWCNGIMERWFGSLRRECFNHIPVFSLKHAHRVAQEYIEFYNLWRPHLALNKDSPCGRVVTFPAPTSKVIKRKVLGGLHHIYFHSEANFEKYA